MPQVTRAALPLGLSDFSSYGYWEAAYQVGIIDTLSRSAAVLLVLLPQRIRCLRARRSRQRCAAARARVGFLTLTNYANLLRTAITK